MLHVLHLPNVVGGHPVALANAERNLGAQSHSLSITNSPYDYKPDIQLNIDQVGQIRGWYRRLKTFFEIRNKYDVFHFNAGSSLLSTRRPGFDLPDLKYYSKNSIKIMTFQGTDARLDYNNTLDESIKAEFDKPFKNEAKNTILGIENHRDYRLSVIENANLNCDHIFVLNPDLSYGIQDSKSSFLPYAISRPDSEFKLATPNLRKSRQLEKSLRVIHLSTNRVLKGTGLIENCIAEAAAHVPISYETIYKQPRQIALAKLSSADIVIDQLVLGWYGAAAVEAMYLGKPVIGYIDKKYTNIVPKKLIQDLPIYQATFTTLTEKLIELAQNKALRLRIANKGKEFSKTWHSPNEVAKCTLEFYEKLRS